MTTIILVVFGIVYLGMILGGLPFLQLDRTGIALPRSRSARFRSGGARCPQLNSKTSFSRFIQTECPPA